MRHIATTIEYYNYYELTLYIYRVADDLPNHLVDLVDHFGGSGVLRGGLGVFASCPLDTAQFFFGTRSIHDETHATTEVGLGERGFFC